MRKLALLGLVATLSGAAPWKLVVPTPKTTLLFTVTGHTTSDAAVSANGRRLYYWQDTTRLYLFDRGSRRFSRVLDNMVGVGTSLAVSPAGDRLAFTRNAEGGKEPQLWTVSLDPATGLANGEPRRVSILVANGPAFSPDGRRIAFGTPTSRTAQNLMVMPVNGGPERVVAETQGNVWPIVWAKPDSIYFGISFQEKENAAKNGIYRVSVSGGKPQFVLRTASWGNYPGLSPDGRFLLAYVPTWDSVLVATASGQRLHTYPADWAGPATPDAWSSGGKAVASRAGALHSVRLVDLTGGQERILSDSADLFFPIWSPDGRKAAGFSWAPFGVVVFDVAAGTRRLIQIGRSTNQFDLMQWSPDGRYIVHRDDDGAFELLDPATSAVRRLPTKSSFGPWVRWRRDSRAIIYPVTNPPEQTDSIMKIDIREITLDGRDRVLHSMGARCNGGAFCGKIIDDSLLSTWINGEYRVTNFRAGGAPRLVYKRDGLGHAVPTFSSNGRWMAVRRQSATDQRWSIEVMHPDGSAHRSVPVSFQVASGALNPWISDDGGELIVTSTDCAAPSNVGCSSGLNVFRVNVTTGKAAAIASLPHATHPRSSACSFTHTWAECSVHAMISNDGRSLVYLADVQLRADFYEIDLTEMLRGMQP